MTDKEKMRRYQAAYYLRHHARIRAAENARRAANREKYRARAAANYVAWRPVLLAIKDRPCMDCGGRFPPECMDFDHRDPTTKRNNVGAMVANSRAALEAEIAKCDLICSNCHRIRTFARKRAARAA